MPFEELACDDGVRNIVAKLKEYFLPHLEVSLPRAFESAVYGVPRSANRGSLSTEYVARVDKGFTRLSKERVRHVPPILALRGPRSALFGLVRREARQDFGGESSQTVGQGDQGQGQGGLSH